MTIQWLGFAENIGSVTTVHSTVSRTGNSVHWFTDERELSNAVDSAESAVIFLRPGVGCDVFELCRDLSLTYPLVSIILLLAADEFDIKRAMHAGAIDAISLPAQENEISQAVREAEQAIKLKISRLRGDHLQVSQTDGRVLTVFGTKGGVGKTTLAVNLAVAFAKSNGRVAVLDLDLQFGDVAIFFDVQPKRTIYEWVKENPGEIEGAVERYMSQHSSGVDLLPAPLRPEFAEVINGEHVGLLIGKLKQLYDYVVIDTPPSLVETSLVALENSEDILMVASLDLPTLKNTKLGIETLESLGMKDRIKVVLNRDSKVDGIRMDMVENIVGTPLFARIPSEGKVVVSSVNKGIPFVLSSPREAVSKSVFSIASQLQNEWGSTQKGQKKNLLNKIFSR